MKKKIEIHYELITRAEISDDIGELINAAEQAILSSHAPYSKFHVGASLLLDDGRIINGSNQENASYPIGFCAERTAIAAKIAQAPMAVITAIAISVMNQKGNIIPPVAPCGMCRQALLEEENRQQCEIKVYLVGNDDNIKIVDSVTELLPFQFDGSILTD